MHILESLTYRVNQFWLMVSLYPKFGSFGKRSYLNRPLAIGNPENIFIGNNVTIKYKTWLAARPQTGEPIAILLIKDSCRIGNFNHIYCTKSITLEENVSTADKVYISDNSHSYEDIKVPIWKQPIKQIDTVVIGEGSWLGENVCVIGAKIGKHSVIGANSVVTKDIPDYSVAVGSPAYIIKRYNPVSKSWEKTKPDGTFF
jgi:acetyltransferase-like isoleucine patch superfamily enzyme